LTDETTTAQTEQAPAVASPEPKQTLENLYDEYNIGTESPGPTPAAEPKAEQTPATNDVAAIHTEIADLRREREAEKAERIRIEEEADLTKAVATLGKEANIEGKEPLLKGFMIAKAAEDQRLRALWNSRKSNPKAWKTALKILADEVKEEFQVANPQIEENQRALDESQRAQTSVAPKQPGSAEKVMSMNDGEFSQFWGRLAGRG